MYMWLIWCRYVWLEIIYLAFPYPCLLPNFFGLLHASCTRRPKEFLSCCPVAFSGIGKMKVCLFCV